VKVGKNSWLLSALGQKRTFADIGLESIDERDPATFSNKEAIGETIQFVITKNISGLGPTWTLTTFTGPGGLAGAERQDTNKLIISFTLGATKKGLKAADRARQQNQNMLLQSLPTFRLNR
jgi:hypothetical protein